MTSNQASPNPLTLFDQPSMLSLENLRNLRLDITPSRLPSKDLVGSLRLTTGVQTPTHSLKAGLINRCVLAQSLLLRLLQVTQSNGLSTDLPGNIAPDVLATLGQNVAFGAPEFGVGVACHGGFDEQDVDVRQIGNVDVVPASLAGPDDGDVLFGEDELGEFVDLAASAGDGTSSVACKTYQLLQSISVYSADITHRRS